MEDLTPKPVKKKKASSIKKTSSAWPWSQRQEERPHPLFTTINKKTGEKKDVAIRPSPSIVNKDRSEAFIDVLSEQDFYYRLIWHPIVMHDNKKDEDIIIALKTEPIIFNKALISLINWSNLLNDLLLLNGVKISNCMDVAPPIGSFVITIYDPQLLQAVDTIVEQAMDIETQEYIDDLTPIFYQQFGEFIEPDEE